MLVWFIGTGCARRVAVCAQTTSRWGGDGAGVPAGWLAGTVWVGFRLTVGAAVRGAPLLGPGGGAVGAATAGADGVRDGSAAGPGAAGGIITAYPIAASTVTSASAVTTTQRWRRDSRRVRAGDTRPVGSVSASEAGPASPASATRAASISSPAEPYRSSGRTANARLNTPDSRCTAGPASTGNRSGARPAGSGRWPASAS